MEFTNTLFKLVHHQRPVVIEELRHRFGELRFPRGLRLAISKGNSKSVLVIKPFEGGGQLPDVVWIHPSWIFLQGHQEDVPLFVGSVKSQNAHHDEV